MLPIVIECRKETPEKGVEAFLEQLKSNLGREDNMPWADLDAAEWELLLLRHPEYEKHLGSADIDGMVYVSLLTTRPELAKYCCREALDGCQWALTGENNYG
ncbi:MAG: hypothetical protein IKO65_08835 [Victivallales bacterium]|nr:hypothetical protein [Victivallales bacterium]